MDPTSQCGECIILDWLVYRTWKGMQVGWVLKLRGMRVFSLCDDGRTCPGSE